MAGNILDRQLTAPAAGEIRFALAHGKDDAAIRRLLRENSMRGEITLSFEREPNYFHGFDIEGLETQTILAYERDQLLCMGRCSIQRRFVNGQIQRVGYESVFDGQTVSVIYSGDTIVAPEAWGTTALSRAWIACVRQLREHYPRGKYYWLLLTSGFRTYRFLPVFWREFYPRFDVATPVNQKNLLDQLACERFGEQYNSEKGIVRFKQPQKLRSGLDAVPAGRNTDPHVAFFLKQNPSHFLGDELVCLTELADENLTRAGRRMIEPRQHESLCRHC
jgi:hypothetical protein